jgi:hypothetical protein
VITHPWVAFWMIVLAASACTSNDGKNATPSSASVTRTNGSPSTAADRHWTLVAIGDSLAHPSSCDGCTDFGCTGADAPTCSTC